MNAIQARWRWSLQPCGGGGRDDRWDNGFTGFSLDELGGNDEHGLRDFCQSETFQTRWGAKMRWVVGGGTEKSKVCIARWEGELRRD